MSEISQQRYLDAIRDLGLSNETEISVALRSAERNIGPIHMIMWQYGFLTTDDLNEVLDRLDAELETNISAAAQEISTD